MARVKVLHYINCLVGSTGFVTELSHRLEAVSGDKKARNCNAIQTTTSRYKYKEVFYRGLAEKYKYNDQMSKDAGTVFK